MQESAKGKITKEAAKNAVRINVKGGKYNREQVETKLIRLAKKGEIPLANKRLSVSAKRALSILKFIPSYYYSINSFYDAYNLIETQLNNPAY